MHIALRIANYDNWNSRIGHPCPSSQIGRGRRDRRLSIVTRLSVCDEVAFRLLVFQCSLVEAGFDEGGPENGDQRVRTPDRVSAAKNSKRLTTSSVRLGGLSGTTEIVLVIASLIRMLDQCQHASAVAIMRQFFSVGR
ncbi:hypothetical protein IP69_21095 [Bosea sp. AAP35]|uniref:hypothetical protein n=1 Tax=Bosea sp. AAP35 TaxID=1523417 RepID=UPI0006B9377B|nr:hypothetical protein [Bosea sp. AAP35]KPF62119.1 hypothetical protein IP69_21095 [Bosea sp. AAP35]